MLRNSLCRSCLSDASGQAIPSQLGQPRLFSGGHLGLLHRHRDKKSALNNCTDKYGAWLHPHIRMAFPIATRGTSHLIRNTGQLRHSEQPRQDGCHDIRLLRGRRVHLSEGECQVGRGSVKGHGKLEGCAVHAEYAPAGGDGGGDRQQGGVVPQSFLFWRHDIMNIPKG